MKLKVFQKLWSLKTFPFLRQMMSENWQLYKQSLVSNGDSYLHIPTVSVEENFNPINVLNQ